MKVKYVAEVDSSKYEMHLTEMTADQLDAVRIILKTVTEQSKKIGDNNQFSLEGLIKAVWKDK